MCKVMEDMRNEAVKADRVRNARRMINSGKLSTEEIAEFTSLTVEEVETLMEKYSA